MIKKSRLFAALLAIVFLLPCIIPCLATETSAIDYADLFERAENADYASRDAIKIELEEAFLADPEIFLRELSLTGYVTPKIVVPLFVTDQWMRDDYSAYYNAVIDLALSDNTTQAEQRILKSMLVYIGETGITVKPMEKIDFAELFSHVNISSAAYSYSLMYEFKDAFMTDTRGFLQALSLEDADVQERITSGIAYAGFEDYDRALFCEYISELEEAQDLSDAQRHLVQLVRQKLESFMADYGRTWPTPMNDFADLFARAYQNQLEETTHQELNSAFSATPYAFVHALSQEEYRVQYTIVDIFRRYWNQNGRSAVDEAVLRTLAILPDRTQAERRVIRWLLSDADYAVYQDPVDYGELFPRAFQAGGGLSDQFCDELEEAFLIDPAAFIRALARESSETQTQIAQDVMLKAYYDNYDREYVRLILNTIEREAALTSAEKQVIGLMWDSVDFWIQAYGPLPTEPEPEPSEPEPTEPAPTEPEPTDPEPTETEPPAPSESTAPEPVPTETIPSGEESESGIPGWVLPAVLIVAALGIVAVVVKVLPMK